MSTCISPSILNFPPPLMSWKKQDAIKALMLRITPSIDAALPLNSLLFLCSHMTQNTVSMQPPSSFLVCLSLGSSFIWIGDWQINLILKSTCISPSILNFPPPLMSWKTRMPSKPLFWGSLHLQMPPSPLNSLLFLCGYMAYNSASMQCPSSFLLRPILGSSFILILMYFNHYRVLLVSGLLDNFFFEWSIRGTLSGAPQLSLIEWRWTK